MNGIQYDFSLLHLNTFAMQVKAKQYSEIHDIATLQTLLNGLDNPNEIFVLGGGSNILFTKDINRWVLHNKIKGIEIIKESDTNVWLRSNAGEVWHEFVMYCVDHAFAGVENLSLIPGTVGAAPMQNIGAYGVEVKDVIESVRCWDMQQKCFIDFSKDECRFGYRDSIFKQELRGKVIITSVIFKLKKHPEFHTEYGNIRQELERMSVHELSIKSVSDAVINIRTSKLPDPSQTGNAGSFFKNPEISKGLFEKLKENYPDMPSYQMPDDKMKIPAGWLIEQCGWKGYRKERYGVHPLQALVLVNYGGAKGEDIYHLSSKILASVEEKFNIELEREVQIL